MSSVCWPLFSSCLQFEFKSMNNIADPPTIPFRRQSIAGKGIACVPSIAALVMDWENELVSTRDKLCSSILLRLSAYFYSIFRLSDRRDMFSCDRLGNSALIWLRSTLLSLILSEPLATAVETFSICLAKKKRASIPSPSFTYVFRVT